MTWYSGVIAFVIIWWMVLFMVLPFGVRTAAEEHVELVPGSAPSAPTRPRLLLKFGVTTGISVVLFAVFWVVAHYDLLNFRNYLNS